MESRFGYLVLVFGYGGHGGVFGRYWIGAWLIGWGVSVVWEYLHVLQHHLLPPFWLNRL